MYHPTNEQAYRTAITAASRPYDTVYGTITFTDSTVMQVSGSNMPTNSITISKQCIDGGELMFGGVFLTTLNLSVIVPSTVDRYKFYDAEVELTYKIKVGTETVGTSEVPIYEEIPLGVFVVADADRLTTMVKLTAYDKMTLLDKEIGDAYITGTPWEVFSQVSAQTGYQLSFTENDLSDFINYTYDLSASKDRGLKTYRDVVKEVCQQLGCFATDDRTGKLALKMFSASSDLTLTYENWYSIVPADYKCKYIAISITSTAGTFVKGSDDPFDGGNIMTIEDAPAWDLGSQEALQTKTDNLYTYLTSIDEYTPCDIDMPSDPTIECGDRLTLVTKKGTIYSLVTSCEWKFHNGMSITSEGKNPYLSGDNVLGSDSARILQQAVEKSRLQFITFTNNAKKVIGDGDDIEIGRAIFTPTTDTTALFVATILVDVDVEDEEETETEDVTVPVKAYDVQQEETVITDINGNPVTLSGTATNTYTYYRDGKCTASIYYTLNDIRVPSEEQPYIATDKLANGQHIITVSYPITGLLAYERVDFRVFMTSEDGTITLPAHTLQATVVGQEITTIDHFSGEIKIDDTINLVSLYNIGAIALDDTANVVMREVISYNVSDDVGRYAIINIGTMSLSDNVEIFMQKLPWGTEEGNYWATEDGNRWDTE